MADFSFEKEVNKDWNLKINEWEDEILENNPSIYTSEEDIKDNIEELETDEGLRSRFKKELIQPNLKKKLVKYYEKKILEGSDSYIKDQNAKMLLEMIDGYNKKYNKTFII